MATFRRLELQTKLEEIMARHVPKPWKTNRVLYQPPETFKMEYPCIRYRLDGMAPVHADDIHYLRMVRWNLTLVDRDPDSEIPFSILTLPYCRMDQYYTADNLHHWTFTLYW